ncbi:hypothetical protein H8S90_09550 [Olivibacter sp. SDN3]|uniref:hypothetical protein n=1 Tax=Olivibacter sp. SDN3 TaxID=2764720 RepID=UPI001650DF8D|nr:hypothetical protein [Olivibacter sp. SDN3]QNL51793.1 hypothetical protein H8S90_09550 [Olivibacter sp. SDN3]
MKTTINLVIEILKKANGINSGYGEPLLIAGYQNEEVATVASFLKQKGFIKLFDDTTLFERKDERYHDENQLLVTGITDEGAELLAHMLRSRVDDKDIKSIEEYINHLMK